MPKISRLQTSLLKAVKREVNARLERSLHNTVPLELQARQQSELGGRFWDVEVKIGRRPTYQLPPDTSVTRVFDDTNGKLLIMGAQGSGKTTTMLELARDLIARAENDASQPIPVLFNLLAWKEDNRIIADWLVAELNLKYGVRPGLGKKLLDRQLLLPLLDGLDELELARQESCIQAINQLLVAENKPKHLAICTRLEAYKNCSTKLRLHGAVYLRPLTDAKIREYLLNARSRELWENIKTEPNLLDLAKIPLFLNMMTLADEEILIHAWKRLASYEELREYLLNACIRRMLTREIESRYYRRKQQPRSEIIRSRLVFLAKRMQESRADIIKEPQPNWLQTKSQKRFYRIGLWLTLGGIVGLKHFILRLILSWNGYIPWNYTRFLNYATERSLLQQVDGRYQFVHELLRDAFALKADLKTFQ